MAMHSRTVWVLGLSVVGSLVIAVGCSEQPASGVPQKAESPVTAGKKIPPQPPPVPPSMPQRVPPSGSVDHLAALNAHSSRGVTPGNNAAVGFLQAMGLESLHPAVRQQYLQMLGISALPEQGASFVTYEEYVQQSRKLGATGRESSGTDQEQLREHIYSATNRPWSPEALPLVAAWLQANQEPLTLVIQASYCPRRFDPLISIGNPPLILDALLPMVQAHRDVARALAARAMLKLNAGSVPEAWQDLLACHRLARLTGQGRTIIEMLVAEAIEGMTCNADQAVLAHGNLAADQARQMYDDLQSLPPLPSVADAIDVGERFSFLSCTQLLADRGWGEMDRIMNLLGTLDGDELKTDRTDFSRMNALKLNWDAIRQMANSWYDRLAAAERQPTWAQRAAATAQIDTELSKLREEVRQGQLLKQAMQQGSPDAVSEHVGRMLIAMLLPAVASAGEAEVRAAETLELTKLGFLLAAYRAENGRYPSQLSELTPKYLAQVPPDLCTGNAPIYKPQPDGYILYSVGVNGRDDNGLRYEDRGTTGDPNQDYDDLVVQVPLKQR